MTDEIKRAVASKVHKEYKSFIDNVVKRGARYAIENTLMIAFIRKFTYTSSTEFLTMPDLRR